MKLDSVFSILSPSLHTVSNSFGRLTVFNSSKNRCSRGPGYAACLSFESPGELGELSAVYADVPRRLPIFLSLLSAHRLILRSSSITTSCTLCTLLDVNDQTSWQRRCSCVNSKTRPSPPPSQLLTRLRVSTRQRKILSANSRIRLERSARIRELPDNVTLRLRFDFR